MGTQADSIMEIMRFKVAAAYSSITEKVLKEEFRKRIERICETKCGQELAAQMTKSRLGRYNSLTVVYFPKASEYKEGDDLYWDPKMINTRGEFEPTISAIRSSGKDFVYLYHELVHYVHYHWGEYKHPPKRLKNDSEEFDGEACEEFRTVGIYEYDGENPSENALRKELKLPRRPCYYYSQFNSIEDRRRQNRKLKPVKQITLADKECSFDYYEPPAAEDKGKGTMLWGPCPSNRFATGGRSTRAPGPLGRA
jgi:hypothetical protein